MSIVTTPIRFFTAAELACKGSGVIRMDQRFATALVALREAWNEPMTLNSVCRTPAHNVKVGGHPTSLHLTENKRFNCATMAADVSWRNWTEEKQLRFAKLARSLGWRVGLHNGFCHIDRLHDIDKKFPSVFLYGTYTGKLLAKLT